MCTCARTYYYTYVVPLHRHLPHILPHMFLTRSSLFTSYVHIILRGRPGDKTTEMGETGNVMKTSSSCFSMCRKLKEANKHGCSKGKKLVVGGLRVNRSLSIA